MHDAPTLPAPASMTPPPALPACAYERVRLGLVRHVAPPADLNALLVSIYVDAHNCVEHSPLMNNTHRKALEAKLATLRAELATCTTKAMAASVQGSIDATTWELYGI